MSESFYSRGGRVFIPASVKNFHTTECTSSYVDITFAVSGDAVLTWAVVTADVPVPTLTFAILTSRCCNEVSYKSQRILSHFSSMCLFGMTHIIPKPKPIHMIYGMYIRHTSHAPNHRIPFSFF